MAKQQKSERPTIILKDVYRITAKYSTKKALIPAEIIDPAFVSLSPRNQADWDLFNKARFRTIDGTYIHIKWIEGLYNRNGEMDEELDSFCQQNYSMPFHIVKSVWISKVDRLSGYWHIIEMEKCN